MRVSCFITTEASMKYFKDKYLKRDAELSWDNFSEEWIFEFGIYDLIAGIKNTTQDIILWNDYNLY